MNAYVCVRARMCVCVYGVYVCVCVCVWHGAYDYWDRCAPGLKIHLRVREIHVMFIFDSYSHTSSVGLRRHSYSHCLNAGAEGRDNTGETAARLKCIRQASSANLRNDRIEPKLLIR